MPTEVSTTMPVLSFNVRGSWRDFPRGEFWRDVPMWWFVDIASGGALRCLGLDGEPSVAVFDVLAVESGTHRGMRRLVHERWPKHGEILVRASDGGLVAWVSDAALMAVFRRAQELELSCLEHTELGSLEVSAEQYALPRDVAGGDETLRSLLARMRAAMIAWAADAGGGSIYEDSRHAFREASRALGLPECDRLGVPAELDHSTVAAVRRAFGGE